MYAMTVESPLYIMDVMVSPLIRLTVVSGATVAFVGT